MDQAFFALEQSDETRKECALEKASRQDQEVLRMRTDEQIVFTAGNPPLRCGRAIWFRRSDMEALVG